jgi:hypothetical protein
MHRAPSIPQRQPDAIHLQKHVERSRPDKEPGLFIAVKAGNKQTPGATGSASAVVRGYLLTALAEPVAHNPKT